MSHPPQRRTLALLFFLYLAQGLPFGYQKELASFLREAGVSLEKIGLSRALTAPWMLKALWAPLVDRFGSERFGRRKSWIVPMLLLLAVTCVIAGFFPPTRSLAGLFAVILVMNVFAATQDIAVDGLAVDLLQGKALGPANTAQVVGYKAGMLFSAALLVPLFPLLGWNGILYAIAGMLVLWALALCFWKEPPTPPRTIESRRSLQAVIATMYASLRQPGAIWLVAFVATYKIGEELVDPMLRPFLIDAGYRKEQLTFWIGTVGMFASLAGSLIGGLLAARIPILSAVLVTSVARSLAMLGQYALTLPGHPSPAAVIAATFAEHLCGGALTTAMFAFMMSRVNKTIGGTHYTLLACVEVIGKLPPSLLSGVLAKQLGFPVLFGLGTALSFFFLPLLLPLHRQIRQELSGTSNPAAETSKVL